MTLVPAYGRDYKSAKDAAADFRAGKDFEICDISSPDNGRYANLEDLRQSRTRSVQIRYGQLRKVTLVQL